MAKRACQSRKVDEYEPIPFDDALRQILKAPPKKQATNGKRAGPQDPPKRGKKA